MIGHASIYYPCLRRIKELGENWERYLLIAQTAGTVMAAIVAPISLVQIAKFFARIRVTCVPAKHVEIDRAGMWNLIIKARTRISHATICFYASTPGNRIRTATVTTPIDGGVDASVVVDHTGLATMNITRLVTKRKILCSIMLQYPDNVSLYGEQFRVSQRIMPTPFNILRSEGVSKALLHFRITVMGLQFTMIYVILFGKLLYYTFRS